MSCFWGLRGCQPAGAAASSCSGTHGADLRSSTGAVPTPSPVPGRGLGDSAGTAAEGVKQDLYRENGPYFCCKKQASCKGGWFPFIDRGQTAAVSPRTGFHGFAQAGQAQLLYSLGPALAESSRGGLTAQESSWAVY